MKYIKYYSDGEKSAIQFFAEMFNISEMVMSIIFSRGYQTENEIREFLYPKTVKYKDPYLLLGMEEAVNRILRAIRNKEKIVIFGDYDVDGISATAIMIKTLKKLGVSAGYYLPSRLFDGYGLTNESIDKVVNKFNPNLIITVDCGISCYKEVEYAKSKGIDTIVTDHHEIPEILPDTIVVNTKLPNQRYTFKGLCGTGVAFKIAQALLGEDEAEEFVAIASIATIADIVPLVDENRTIVSRGLDKIGKYLPVGVKKLFEHCKVPLSRPSATDIAFKIAPKLNASGRMGEAEDSLLLYLATNSNIINKQIEKIINYNTKRQELCNTVYEDAKKLLANRNMSNESFISLYSEKWDHGILGIVCSRLMEEYNKPVFLFAKSGSELKGSARSITDINIHTLLSSMQDILTSFGGHSVAAGLSLDINVYNNFLSRLASLMAESISSKVFQPIRYYDEDVTLDMLNDKLLEDLDRLEPYGADNPKPLFRIKSSNIKVNPLKTFITHANILIDKKLQLIMFNYTNDYCKLKLCKQANFIFEFQGKFKNTLKGIVREYSGSYELCEQASNYLNPIKLNQLGCPKQNTEFVHYPQSKLLEFISFINHNHFGTAFIANNVSDFLDFCKNYNVNDLSQFAIYDTSNLVGENCIVLSPKSYEFAKNYNRLVFLDPLLDDGIISEIKKTSVEVLVPLEKKHLNTLFLSIDESRTSFVKVFYALSKLKNREFINIFEAYSILKKEKIFNVTFANFYFAFLTFNDLKIITTKIENSCMKIIVNNNKKQDLSISQLYNTVCFIKKCEA